jgi:hypothetical protein
MGLDAVLARVERVAAQADVAAKAIVTQSAAVVEAAAKSGSHKKGEPHVGGDKPNIVTGTLRRSIRTDPVTRSGIAEYSTKVAPRVIYARRVELGYQGSRGYAYFGPAVRDSMPKLAAIQQAQWAKFMKL